MQDPLLNRFNIQKSDVFSVGINTQSPPSTNCYVDVLAVFLASYGELSEARINTGLDSQNERFKIIAKLIYPYLLYLCLFIREFNNAAWLG